MKTIHWIASFTLSFVLIFGTWFYIERKNEEKKNEALSRMAHEIKLAYAAKTAAELKKITDDAASDIARIHALTAEALALDKELTAIEIAYINLKDRTAEDQIRYVIAKDRVAALIAEKEKQLDAIGSP